MVLFQWPSFHSIALSSTVRVRLSESRHEGKFQVTWGQSGFLNNYQLARQFTFNVRGNLTTNEFLYPNPTSHLSCKMYLDMIGKIILRQSLLVEFIFDCRWFYRVPWFLLPFTNGSYRLVTIKYDMVSESDIWMKVLLKLLRRSSSNPSPRVVSGIQSVENVPPPCLIDM